MRALLVLFALASLFARLSESKVVRKVPPTSPQAVDVPPSGMFKKNKKSNGKHSKRHCVAWHANGHTRNAFYASQADAKSKYDSLANNGNFAVVQFVESVVQSKYGALPEPEWQALYQRCDAESSPVTKMIWKREVVESVPPVKQAHVIRSEPENVALKGVGSGQHKQTTTKKKHARRHKKHKGQQKVRLAHEEMKVDDLETRFKEARAQVLNATDKENIAAMSQDNDLETRFKEARDQFSIVKAKEGMAVTELQTKLSTIQQKEKTMETEIAKTNNQLASAFKEIHELQLHPRAASSLGFFKSVPLAMMVLLVTLMFAGVCLRGLLTVREKYDGMEVTSFLEIHDKVYNAIPSMSEILSVFGDKSDNLGNGVRNFFGGISSKLGDASEKVRDFFGGIVTTWWIRAESKAEGAESKAETSETS